MYRFSAVFEPYSLHDDAETEVAIPFRKDENDYLYNDLLGGK